MFEWLSKFYDQFINTNTVKAGALLMFYGIWEVLTGKPDVGTLWAVAGFVGVNLRMLLSDVQAGQR